MKRSQLTNSEQIADNISCLAQLLDVPARKIFDELTDFFTYQQEEEVDKALVDLFDE